MGPWDFWASPFGVGLPADVALAIQNGTATEEQQSRAKQATVVARHALIGATFNAPQDDELELPRRILLMPSVSGPQHRDGDAASNCSTCGGERIWKVARRTPSLCWRQYCRKCHGRTSYNSRCRRRTQYNDQIAVRRRTDPKFKAYEIWKSAKDRAKRKGLQFSLDLKKVQTAVVRGKCQVTGLSFSMAVARGKQGALSPSIDRKNPREGYTNANCQIVCWLYNRAKGDDSHAEVMLLVEALNAIG